MINDFIIIILINNFIICYIFLNYYHKMDVKNKNLEKKNSCFNSSTIICVK